MGESGGKGYVSGILALLLSTRMTDLVIQICLGFDRSEEDIKRG